MKTTLEAFIDPKNIPKKYGGELEFQFGDMPILDPELEKVLEWEGGRKDFPQGPMFWQMEGEKMRGVAVGSVGEGGVMRREDVCLVRRPVFEPEPQAVHAHVEVGKENGSLEVPGSAPLRPELLSAPTEMDLPDTVTATEPAIEAAKAGEGQKVMGDGPVVLEGAKPVDVVTAGEPVKKLKDLSLDEKKGEAGLVNGAATAPAAEKTS